MADCTYDDDGDPETPEVPLTEDQRGAARPLGDACDIGAYEVGFACDDAEDNDSDGRIDFDPVTFANPGNETTPPAGSGDPGCKNPTWFGEDPGCQDGLDNDGDGMIDYDAGLSRNGVADPGGPDEQCVGKPYRDCEKVKCYRCGLGVELALLLLPLMWLLRRRRMA